jgi:hypothetical protein
MRIEIDNDNQNWLNWGNLVLTWIRNPKGSRPHNVGDLNRQLRDNHIEAKVDGPDTRPVEFWDYSDNDTPLRVALPNERMLDARLKTVDHGQYPLPMFYNIAFAGATRADLSPEESLKFAARRIGEYSVNECC